jgi:hypothetical protein
MPVLPYSLRSIYTASGDKAHLTEFLYPLVEYFQWWRDTRDFGDGLVMALHNWETGTVPCVRKAWRTRCVRILVFYVVYCVYCTWFYILSDREILALFS